MTMLVTIQAKTVTLKEKTSEITMKTFVNKGLATGVKYIIQMCEENDFDDLSLMMMSFFNFINDIPFNAY